MCFKSGNKSEIALKEQQQSGPCHFAQKKKKAAVLQKDVYQPTVGS